MFVFSVFSKKIEIQNNVHQSTVSIKEKNAKLIGVQ